MEPCKINRIVFFQCNKSANAKTDSDQLTASCLYIETDEESIILA